MDCEKVGVAGLGLIGASVAQGLSGSFAESVLGFDPDKSAQNLASSYCTVKRGLSDLDGVDLLVLAAPPSAVCEMVAQVAEWNTTPVVTDVASVKSLIADAVPQPLRQKTVPGHPMAGHETAGPTHARSDLFHGARWILCPFEESSDEATALVLSMVRHLRALPLVMEARDHDAFVAQVSHLPHVLSSLLLSAAQGTNTEAAGASWRDMTRVGGSNPELWADILLANKAAMGGALKDAGSRLKRVQDALNQEDRAALVRFFEEAKEAKRS
ncbi:MAG TPA: prephenate dehydrogenase/arogenate dehydrogenase family protein [Fimbriimonadaceae bacterium]|nr:prephenate dehydrogenase/arogenate dehydrogenase family protein [Fimbriimonadaceae bacterium]